MKRMGWEGAFELIFLVFDTCRGKCHVDSLPSIWIGKQDSGISSLHGIADDPAFAHDGNRRVFLCVWWHHHRVCLSHDCGQSLGSAVVAISEFCCREAGMVSVLLVPIHPWYMVHSGHSVNMWWMSWRNWWTASDHLDGLFLLMWPVNSHPRGTHSV